MRRSGAISRSGFTLMEVMVSVIIISVVIAALLQLFANNTHLIGGVGERVDDATRSTLLLGTGDLGFETKTTTLDALVEGFDVDDDLRRRLKRQKVSLTYAIDGSLGGGIIPKPESPAADAEGDATESDALGIEIGRTFIRLDDRQSALVRVRFQ